MKYYMETYGCVANKVDSDIVEAALQKKGWKRVDSPEEADIVFINTCAVKLKTEEHMVSRISKLPKEKLVVMGCLVDVNPSRLRELGVRRMYGPRRYHIMGKELGVDIPQKKAGVEKLSPTSTVHSVFIEEGCVSACTFCATRFARGWLTSFEEEDIIKEVEEAVRNGAVEIRLTGQDTGAYGLDRGTNLVELLSSILEKVEGEYRIRVGMMSPEHAIRLIDEGYLDLFRDERLYLFFHLPVQSGNNRVLRLMGRKYTAEEYRELVNKIRRRYPEALIETDVIVGFPTETREEFMDTVELVKELEIDVVNISRYSPRPGTPASKWKQIPSNEKKWRSQYLTRVHEELSLQKYGRYIGRKERALLTETTVRDWRKGRLQNYKLLVVKGGEVGEFRDVVIRDVTPRYLLAEAV